MCDRLATFLSVSRSSPPCVPVRGRRPWWGRGGGPVRSSVPVNNRRRILCVFPRYTPAFGTFNHAYRLMKGVRAFMPPQGLLLIAAYMPQEWQARVHRREHAQGAVVEFCRADAIAGQVAEL